MSNASESHGYRVLSLPPPDVDALGYCTVCGAEERFHTTSAGAVSVREFHRQALGRNAVFVDEIEGDDVIKGGPWPTHT